MRFNKIALNNCKMYVKLPERKNAELSHGFFLLLIKKKKKNGELYAKPKILGESDSGIVLGILSFPIFHTHLILKTFYFAELKLMK